jgi:hypothetical protein
MELSKQFIYVRFEIVTAVAAKYTGIIFWECDAVLCGKSVLSYLLYELEA